MSIEKLNCKLHFPNCSCGKTAAVVKLQHKCFYSAGNYVLSDSLLQAFMEH